MNKYTKIIVAGTAATAVSFFLPWINSWVGGIAPSKIFEVGSDAMSFGTLVFIGSFLLAAVTCALHAMGKENAKLALAAGAMPFLVLLFAIVRSNALMQDALGSNFAWSDFGQVVQLVAIGLPVYFLGAAATLGAAIMELKGQEPAGFISPDAQSIDDAM